MAISNSAEWNELYNRFYCKLEIYNMSWSNVDISKYIIACARFGGPIATVRDAGKLLLLASESTRPRVNIYTASGLTLASFPWDKGKIVTMGWTDSEVLVCVLEGGDIYQYSIHGAEVAKPFSLWQQVSEQVVSECCFWGHSVLIVSSTHQLYMVPDLRDPVTVKLASPGLEEAPHSIAVIEPQFTVSGNLEVLLAVGQSITVVDEESAQDQKLELGPLTRMAVSPNGNFLACFTFDGKLRVLSTDFTKNLSEVDLHSDTPPAQLVWCGTDSVLLYWPDQGELVMVGPYGDTIRYSFDEPLVLIPECDGVRLLSNSLMEFVQRVPDSIVSIFGVGSTDPAALLFEAMEHFEKRSAKADENIRAIGPADLPAAVETCIDAAGHEFDVHQQKALLRAAAYGRAFCAKFPRDRFPETCKVLRVLNAVRHYETGVPLSLLQLQLLTPPVLIARLVNAYRHLLALKISDWLGLDKENVLRHWACAKIEASSDVSEEAILEAIVSKLRTSATMSYAQIADTAHKMGRTQLAAMLLDYEPKAAEQVPLLIRMGEDERALAKAVESGDTDLVYLAIFHLQKHVPEKELFRMIQAKPLARDLFVSWARENDGDALKKFHFTTGNPAAAAEVLVKESYQAALERSGRGSALTTPRIKILEQATELYSQNKEYAFHAKMADEAAKLLKAQQELEISTRQDVFVDSSVSDSIRTCIAMGNHKAAQKLRVDFKVPDKRFYWLKIKALAHARDWDALDKFAKERKPPVGYGAFAEACIEQGMNSEAIKYIGKITDLQARAEAFARIGMVNEAAEAATQAKDGELLNRLRSTFMNSNTSAAAIIDTFRDKLSLPGG